MSKRMQFEVSDARFKQLQELMEACGIESQKDLFNNALSLLEWAATERNQGRIIASVDEKEKRYKELSMVVLENAKRNPHFQITGQVSRRAMMG
jgi:hypothetical protein